MSTRLDPTGGASPRFGFSEETIRAGGLGILEVSGLTRGPYSDDFIRGPVCPANGLRIRSVSRPGPSRRWIEDKFRYHRPDQHDLQPTGPLPSPVLGICRATGHSPPPSGAFRGAPRRRRDVAKASASLPPPQAIAAQMNCHRPSGSEQMDCHLLSK